MWFCILAHHRLLLALKSSVRNCPSRRKKSWPRVSSRASFRAGPGPWFPKLTFELQTSHDHPPLLSYPWGPYCFLASCGLQLRQTQTQRCLQSAMEISRPAWSQTAGVQISAVPLRSCGLLLPMSFCLSLLMCKMGGGWLILGLSCHKEYIRLSLAWWASCSKYC